MGYEIKAEDGSILVGGDETVTETLKGHADFFNRPITDTETGEQVYP